MHIAHTRSNIGGTDATVTDAAAAFEFDNTKSGDVRGDPGCFCVAADGTAVTVQPWYYDETFKAWYKVGGAVVVATSAGAVAFPAVAGVKMTLQVTARTGVTKVGVGYFGNVK